MSPSIQPTQKVKKTCKYTIQNCLPLFLHNIQAKKQSSTNGDEVSILRMPYPHQQVCSDGQQESEEDAAAEAPVEPDFVYVSDAAMSAVRNKNTWENVPNSNPTIRTQPPRSLRRYPFLTRVKAAGSRFVTLMRQLRH